ncbi:sorting nexin 1 KNAG_0L01930 [Huiozyma naganishii CBS 8797]|uniref:PX domain-containing protein n=1 Tax=Huiozyma naganishii (strain ATCC MYA-139 / BCRC 22969 / CBS 8797 / KCTC 17520 / NBRC 10181 / NCYC 3082 / Yp74L-3) TaxID=1071383 RepID=J7S3T6_HUIN7|nr:hypothetical protein KNAG_0L01930 [Kazachstania naganishii CBS 8797]CCK72812.1 hypothetical protein KNAG_0L01930 [Kazachstania naganishii CBS 8797]
MNYRGGEEDDALSAPVWDELADQGQTSVPELTATFNDLGASEHTAAEEDHESEGPEAVDQAVEHTQKGLLERLAPEEDPLSDLKGDSGSGVTNAQDGGAPLFGSVLSPLPVNDNDFIHTETSPTKGRAAKPQRLFNAARLRRRPPNSDIGGSAAATATTTQDTEGGDPLKNAQLTTESEDQADSARDTTEQDNGAAANTTQNDILQQIQEPLYHLSPKKGEDESHDTMDTETDTHETEADQGEPHTTVPFTIEVNQPIKVGELTSAHMEYTVHSESPAIAQGYSRVQRRYTDFRWLYRQLQSNHWGKVISPPPEKQIVRSFKRDFIENRRFQMETMLKKIAADPLLQGDQDFVLFLTSENFSKDSKVREHVSGSGAYNDSKDLSEIHISEIQLLGAEDAAQVFKQGGIDAEVNRGFMNLSFGANPPKYIEPDAALVEQRTKFDLLEEQLKQLYRSLELVDTQRNELAVTIEEFSGVIRKLSDLAVTNQSSDLLTSFAEVHDNIKASLERSSLQESLTMGATLDDYIRSIASVKAIFNQRNKLGYFLGIVDDDLAKKKVNLSKYRPAEARSAKFKSLAAECETLQGRHDKIVHWWNKLGLAIKREVALFEREKITEFRNSMEISLEAAIESQKECIELWETFYTNSL